MADTVKVQHTDALGNKYKVIDRSEYDANTHKIYEDENAPRSAPDPREGLKGDALKAYEADEMQRKLQANRGISGGGATLGGTGGRNPSGTYSEPTPSDIRYPDKDATEFENNHGAFIGKSAAQIREAIGLDDKPGGLVPELHEEVQQKEQIAAAANVMTDPRNRAALAKPAKDGGGKGGKSGSRQGGDESSDGDKGEEDLDAMTVSELRETAEKEDVDLSGVHLKDDIIKAIKKGRR